MITVIDYGLNNVRSVVNALARLGKDCAIADDARSLAAATGIILPGVGSFSAGMRALRRGGLDTMVRECAARGVAVLGICLGMQMLAAGSDEARGGEPGMRIMDGHAVRFAGDLKVPHVGWSRVKIRVDTPLLAGLGSEPYMYFVHSYHLPAAAVSDPLALTEYGGSFASAVRRDNVWGVQFHPEKSGRAGLRVLENFARLVGRGVG